MLVRRRAVALVVALAFTAAMAFFASRGGVDNSLEVWFVEDDPALVSYRSFLEKFGNDEVVVIVISGDGDAITVDRLTRLAGLSEALQTISGVARVRSLANERLVRSSIFGPSIVPVIDRPVGLDDLERARERLAIGQASAFVGSDGQSLVAYVWLEATPDIDVERGRILDEIRLATESSLADAGENASMGGLGVIHEALNRTTLAEGSLFVALSYLVIVIMLYLITRRLAWTLVALLAVTAADLALLGAMSLLNRPINMITIALPPLVMILGVANVIHMVTGVNLELAGNKRRLRDLMAALAGAATPCLFNAITTAVAFMSLTTASMAVTRDYGLFAALGVIFAFVFSLILMTAMLPRVMQFRTPGRGHQRIRVLVERVMLYSMRHRTQVVATSVLVVVIAVFVAKRIDVDTHSIGFLPENHPARIENGIIENAVGPYVPLEFVLTVPEAKDWKRADFMSRLVEIQTALEADSAIGHTASVADVLRDLYTTVTGTPVGPRWAPEDDLEVDGLLSLISRSGDQVTLQPVVAQNERSLRLSATVEMMSARGLMSVSDRALTTIRRLAPDGVEVASSGYLPLYGQIVLHTLDDQVKSFSLAFILVFIVVAIALRSWRFTLIAVPPNLLPIVIILAVMGAGNIRLDLATVTVAAVVLGVIVDDTIHILYRLRRELARRQSFEAAIKSVARASGVAVFSTSIVFAVGFLTTSLAASSAIANPGLLTAVAVLAALATDLVLLPAFASFVFERRNPTRAVVLRPEREVRHGDRIPSATEVS
jgi:predicted RND superfamily exporter protein